MESRVLLGGLVIVLLGIGVVYGSGFLAGGWQSSGSQESIVSVYPTVESTENGYAVAAEIGHSGFESETGVARGLRVRMLDASGDTVEVVELGDIRLASIETEEYRFNVTTEREPVRFVIEMDDVTNLDENLEIIVEGRERIDERWEPFYESEETWRYAVVPPWKLVGGTAYSLAV